MLIDTHAHLDQEEFDADREEVIARARAAGVDLIVSIAVSAASSAATAALAERFPSVWASAGIHPNYTHEAGPSDWDDVRRWAQHPRVVALGETGLDRYRDYAPLDLQRDYFDRHLRLSQQLDKPFVVHTRDSAPLVLEMLRDARARGPLRGVMHSFTGDESLARECLDLGLFLSFAGMTTFKKSDDLRAVARAIPADRLLVETDSPYLAPHPLRGKRNEPALVVHTARCLAETRGVSLEELAAQSSANARALFRLPAES